MLRILLLAAALLSAPTVFATPVNAPPPVSANEPAGPRVALETNQGRIVIELYSSKAPQTVANFLAYLRDGHYNGTVFHRVIPDLLIQAGAYTIDLQEKPSRAPIINEAGNGLSNLRGTVAAARKPGEENSASSQFFINVVDNPQLDKSKGDTPLAAGFAVFGHVVEGMDVVDKIRAVKTVARAPFTADVPEASIVIERAVLMEQ